MGLGAVAYALVSRLTGLTGSVSAQVADNTPAGGNARGANAVDWQMLRTLATQVASAPGAFIGGGEANTASGTRSAVAGGLSNSATALRAFVGGGNTNTATGQEAAIAGGALNVANATYSWIPGGRTATARGVVGRGAWASDRFSNSGDAQAGEHVVRQISTDGAAARLTADSGAASATNTINLPINGTYMVRLLVTAQQTGGSAGTAGDSAGWELTALVKRGANAAATVLVGSSGPSVAPLYSDAAAAAWRVGLTADTANGGLAVTATGETNKTIRWVARVLSVEVTA